MIVDGNNTKQRSILINKCFYQTMVKIMHMYEEQGSLDFANKTIEAISAYHGYMQKKNNSDKQYAAAFETIDNAIRNIANKVFYTFGNDSFNQAYNSFKEYDYIKAIRGRLHKDYNK